MLVSLSVIVHLGLTIVDVVCFRGDISQTFVRHVGYMMYAYGKPSAERFHTGHGPDNQNSTSTVGAGWRFLKKIPTWMTSSKK
jgi:hypothetical protein